MIKVLLFAGFFLVNVLGKSEDIDLKHLKCLVCRTIMKEFEAEVFKANPNKVVEVGSFRLDANGNAMHKTVPLSQSEMHLSDILENLCGKFGENYVRARKRSNNQLILMNLFSPSGGMNSMMSEVDIVQDGDLNKSLEHYCNAIVEEFEEDIVAIYVSDADDKKEGFCRDISGLCENYPDDEDKTDATSDSNSEADFLIDRDEL
ncbi:protein seele [Pseudomyrmex gracilis]|uniref:protein seele n=1 Tax=Pseudomyrmex gracilis TaxID=219809 RepID=UPI000994D2C8|nr:protein seele [Pseudomyrmex gracilis]